MDTEKGCGLVKFGDAGVDLNRNFAIDFGQIDNIMDY
jgi:hypothetical protein